MTTPVLERAIIHEIVTTGDAWPLQGEWRYADYLRLPEDGNRYEIIEGVLFVANALSADHQYSVTKLVSRLDRFVEEKELGVIYAAPFEVHLSEASKPVQPDVLFIPKENQPTANAQFFEGAPALIAEVISPSSFRHDRTTKFGAYERAGVAEYWIVVPKTRSVEVYTLSNGEYALFGQYVGDEMLISKLLEGFTLKVSTLFPPQPNRQS